MAVSKPFWACRFPTSMTTTRKVTFRQGLRDISILTNIETLGEDDCETCCQEDGSLGKVFHDEPEMIETPVPHTGF